MPGLKRQPNIGKTGRHLHERWSKSTLHEALLDMWMETNAKDCSPDEMTDEEWRSYEQEVERRSGLRRRAG